MSALGPVGVARRLRDAGGRALLLREIAGASDPQSLHLTRIALEILRQRGLVRFDGGTDRWSLIEPEASEWLQQQTGS